MAKLIITIEEHLTDDPRVVGYQVQSDYDDSDGSSSAVLEFLDGTGALHKTIHDLLALTTGETIEAGAGPITESAKTSAISKLRGEQFPDEL